MAAEEAIAKAALERGHSVIVDRTNRTRGHRERWLRVAKNALFPAVAVVMTASEALCRQRNRERNAAARVSEERMDRMLAVLEPVQPDEGFYAVFAGDAVSMTDILSRVRDAKEALLHEYCNQAR
jgi:predicted kinase